MATECLILAQKRARSLPKIQRVNRLSWRCILLFLLRIYWLLKHEPQDQHRESSTGFNLWQPI